MLGAGYDSIVPDAPNAESHPLTKALVEKTNKWVEQYLEAMEKVIYQSVIVGNDTFLCFLLNILSILLPFFFFLLV